MFERSVLLLDLDTFFVSVERLMNSQLFGKPILIGGTSGRGVVASCSYEARKFGVHAGMPMKMALKLCPDATVLRGDMDNYTKYSKLVTEIIKDKSPIVEKASIDEFYVDLTGMDKYFGCHKWSTELRQTIIRESGLPISFGLSVNKLISKIGAGEAKPNGGLTISSGKEKNFIAPLSISKIPSVGKVTYKKLSFMGVRTIKKLSEIPPELLQREFGKQGRDLWKKANALDDSPVVEYSEKKSISKERTFAKDSTDIRKIKALIMKMAMELAFELRKKEKLASIVTLKIRYTDFNTYTKQKKIAYTARDNALIDIVKKLFDVLYERRQLIRLVGVKFGGLVSGSVQLNLFEDSVEEMELLQVMDQIRNRFGSNKITRASLI